MLRCRFALSDGKPRVGEVRGDRVVELDLSGSAPVPLPRAGEVAVEGKEHRFDDVRLLVPCIPTKIVAVGVNYRAHAAEMGKGVPEEPLLFLKPPSALRAHGETIELPSMSTLVHHEVELAAVIGKRLRRGNAASARAAIAGFTCLNDVTARDLQRKDVQFTRGKGFDTFAPVGPWLATDLDPLDLALRCRVNGELRQEGRTSDMVWDVFTLVAFISNVMTLEPGDIVTTGTPPGVGPLTAGDRVEIEVEGIGALVNHCVAEPA